MKTLKTRGKDALQLLWFQNESNRPNRPNMDVTIAWWPYRALFMYFWIYFICKIIGLWVELRRVSLRAFALFFYSMIKGQTVYDI